MPQVHHFQPTWESARSSRQLAQVPCSLGSQDDRAVLTRQGRDPISLQLEGQKNAPPVLCSFCLPHVTVLMAAQHEMAFRPSSIAFVVSA